MSPVMKPPDSGVTVRMYRQGLGDCFLLAFPARDKKAFYLLIDCGVLFGTADAVKEMRKIAQHIHDSTEGRIDVLVATHEHWDHVSGFEQAQSVFDKIHVETVWVAWTEDRGNNLAERLRKKHAVSLTALHAAVNRLRAFDPDTAGWVQKVLDFHGGLAANGKESKVAKAMDYVVKKSQAPQFLRPGQEPLRLDGVKDVRVYVLGPPEDEKLLSRSNPSKKTSEVYEKPLEINEANAFFVAVVAGVFGKAELDPSDWETLELSYPFNTIYHIPTEEARSQKFFKQHYGFGKDSTQQGPAWRRADSDWLQAASNLALKLDSDTNNTSLALAIELAGDKVLLFPGDAQVGNWLSWEKLTWTEKTNTGKEEKVTGADLLGRTVFYKVGHHASHNATLRAKGLELMTRSELVAMIPVDEKMAHKPKGGSPKGWDMPFGPLLDRLLEKTKGRVIRLDEGLPRKKPKTLTEKEWAAFKKRSVEDEEGFYIEYTVR